MVTQVCDIGQDCLFVACFVRINRNFVLYAKVRRTLYLSVLGLKLEFRTNALLCLSTLPYIQLVGEYKRE